MTALVAKGLSQKKWELVQVHWYTMQGFKYGTLKWSSVLVTAIQTFTRDSEQNEILKQKCIHI